MCCAVSHQPFLWFCLFSSRQMGKGSPLSKDRNHLLIVKELKTFELHYNGIPYYVFFQEMGIE